MSIMGMYELTHPESLSDAELREILENRCIDFSNYKNLPRSELIELYKRVALPLPQRQSENTENSDTKEHNEVIHSVNESHKSSVSSNGTTNTKTCLSETKMPESSCMRPKSPVSEFRQTPKKIRLCNSNNITKCNGIDKRISDEKYDGAPSKKRQKITWP